MVVLYQDRRRLGSGAAPCCSRGSRLCSPACAARAVFVSAQYHPSPSSSSTGCIPWREGKMGLSYRNGIYG